MGNAGICRRCSGKGTRWTGGPPVKQCYKCKGKGVVGAGSEATTWRNPELKGESR